MIEYKNISKQALIEEIIKNGNGSLNEFGCLTTDLTDNISTKELTYVVLDSSTENTIYWGKNKQFSPSDTKLLHAKISGYLTDKEVFIQTSCSVNNFKLPFKLITTDPYHALYTKILYAEFDSPHTQYTIYSLPLFLIDEPIIVYDLWNFNIYICGINKPSEIKKAITYLLTNIVTDLNILPLKCLTNFNDSGDSTVFIGSSEVEKRIILNYKSKYIIGNENHHWTDDGLVGVELGITLDLDKYYENDDSIKNCINKFGSIIENYNFATISLNNIPNFVPNSIAKNPNNVIMFVNDYTGVLPLISKITSTHAFYFYLLINHDNNWSEAIHPHNIVKYADKFYSKLNRHRPNIWLINTGFNNNVGVSQYDIKNAINFAQKNKTAEDYDFANGIWGFKIPIKVEGLDNDILFPMRDESFKEEVDNLFKAFNIIFNEYADFINPELKFA